MSSSSSSSSSGTSCQFGIELTREVSNYVEGRTQGHRMRVTVTRYNNVDPNIFLYQEMPANPETGLKVSAFIAVCSPADLEEYPAAAPQEGTNYPFFRLASLDLVFRNRDLLEETWLFILSDRDELLRTLEAMCNLHTDEVDAEGDF